jgi:hypothetical protein
MDPQSLQAWRVVRVYDPAIDHDGMGIEAVAEYARSRSVELLRFLPGERPTIFHVRRLARSQIRWVREASSDDERRERAFRAGVTQVTDVRRADGGRFDWLPPASGSKAPRPAPEDALEVFGEIDVQEIGGVIWLDSFLARDLPRRYPLPATSLDAIEAIIYHRAVQTSASAQSSSATPSEERRERPTTAQQSSPSGDAPTGATATG